MSKVNIVGLNKADVLAKLYNAVNPGGMGLLQAGHGPVVMCREQAETLLTHGSDISGDYPVGTAAMRNSNLYFDYLHGRCLKTDLTSDEEFDSWGFDRDNGGDGAAQRVIDHLRETKSVERVDGGNFMDTQLSEEDSLHYLIGLLGRNSWHRRDGLCMNDFICLPSRSVTI